MYKSYTFASPGHNCSQPLEHCNKKQLTKEAHFVSETGLAKLNKQFLSELYGHWLLITESNRLGQIYSEALIVAYRKDKSLKDLLVRAKIPSHIEQQHFGVINGKGQVTILQNLFMQDYSILLIDSESNS